MSDRLKITFFNLNPDKNANVVATFGVHILSMDLFLSKLKLVKKKDGSFYAAPPSEEYTCPRAGKKMYADFFWFGSKSSDFFQKEVMKAVDTYCKLKNISNPIYE